MTNATECPDNATMQEDMERIAREFPYIEKLKGTRVLITGATGLIGSQCIKALGAINRIHNGGITIYALVRNEKKAGDIIGSLIDRGDVRLIIGDVTDITELPEVDYIIHGASPTGSRYFVEHPVETLKIGVMGTMNILELARDAGLKGMVYLSSLEVYGTPTPQQEWMSETDFGSLDPANVRSSYSEGKRMAECQCVSYAKEYDVPVCIARLSQTFGPGVDYDDGRVFMDFARCAMEGRDVVLHTAGRTLRTYLYTADAVMGILYLLTKGSSAEAYNITNKTTAITIKEMAEMVCETIGNGKVKAVVDVPEDISGFGYNPEMVIRLATDKLEQLGWQAKVGFPDMLYRLAAGVINR